MNESAGGAGSKTRGPTDALEGVAFQFCKVATVALICGRFTLIVASGLAAVLYGLAYFRGRRTARCVLRYPLLIASLWSIVCAASIVLLVRPDLNPLRSLLPH